METIPRPAGATAATLKPQTFRTWQLFSTVAVVEVVVAAGFNRLLLTRETFVAASGGQLDLQQAEHMLQLSERFAWLGYVATVPSLLVRIALAALVLQLALLYFDDIASGFGTVFRACVIAHFVRVSESLLVLGTLLQLDDTERARRVLAGNPFSMSRLVSTDHLAALRTLTDRVSLGSLLWVIVVAWGLTLSLRRPPKAMFATVFVAWMLMVAMGFALSEVLGMLTSR